PHHCHELAFVHLQVHAGQRVDLGVPHAVGPDDLVEFDDRFGHGAHRLVAARSTMTGVPAVSPPLFTTVTLPSVGPSVTSTCFSSPSASVHTCGGASSFDRSRRCPPGGRGSSRNPAP